MIKRRLIAAIAILTLFCSLSFGQDDDSDKLQNYLKEYKNKTSVRDKMQILSKIAALKNEKALDALISLFTNERNNQIRRIILSRIGSFKTKKALKFLKKVISNPSLKMFHYFALNAIGSMKTKEAFAILKSVLASTNDRTIKSSTINAIANTKTKEAFKFLCSEYKRNRGNRYLIRNFLYAIARFRDKKAHDFIYNEYKNGRDVSLRSAALDALGSFSKDKTKKILMEAAKNDPNSMIRASALRGLRNFKNDKDVFELAKKLAKDEKDYSVRMALVDIFKNFETKESVAILIKFAKEKRYKFLRDRAIDALTSFKSEKILNWFMKKGLFASDPMVVEISAKVIAKRSVQKAVKYLLKALNNRNKTAKVAVIEALGDLKAKAAVDKLLALLNSRSTEICSAASIALSKIGSKNEKVIKFFLKLLKSSNLKKKLMAIDILGETRDPRLVPHLIKYIKYQKWQVRAAVISALGKMRSKKAVDHLIERLGKEKGRLKGDILTALSKLTGRTFGFSKKLWKAWWKVNRDKFKFPKKGAKGAHGHLKTAASFYGIPVVSKRIIFLLDISGSMSGGSKAGGRSKIDVAKEELSKVIKGLNSDTYFNIIFFNSNLNIWRKHLTRAVVINRKSALKFVNNQRAAGGTNIYNSLEKAFKDKHVDTIFLLSDGAPSAGKITNTKEILKKVKAMNQLRRIIIHSISLGKSQFMKKLADQNGGQYVER